MGSVNLRCGDGDCEGHILQRLGIAHGGICGVAGSVFREVPDPTDVVYIVRKGKIIGERAWGVCFRTGFIARELFDGVQQFRHGLALYTGRPMIRFEDPLEIGILIQLIVITGNRRIHGEGIGNFGGR